VRLGSTWSSVFATSLFLFFDCRRDSILAAGLPFGLVISMKKSKAKEDERLSAVSHNLNFSSPQRLSALSAPPTPNFTNMSCTSPLLVPEVSA
jgi:hypothetical protein